MTPAPVDAVLVLQRSDVEHLAAHPERHEGVPLLFTDPGIMEAGLQAGLRRYELRRLAPPPTLIARAYTEALNLATAIDLELSDVRRDLFGPGQWHGWDLALLYLTLQRAFTQRLLGQAVEAAFDERRIGLLRPSNPALFNWDSMLSTEIVGADPARWQVVQHCGPGRHWNPALLEMCFDHAGVAGLARSGHAECLTHIPTCFYDAGTFAEAVGRRFERNIDLPGLYCDVPVRRASVPLLRRHDDAGMDASLVRYHERALQVFGERLAALVPGAAARAQQARALARRCLLQAVDYAGLRQALAGHRPHLVLADHDTGRNGPLFSLAAHLGSPITVLPHSVYPTMLLPHAEQVTAVQRDGAGASVRSVLGQPVATRSVRFRPPLQALPRPAPRRVTLLLNTMLSEGLSQVELFALIPFFQQLAAACERHGSDLAVRLKPSTPALSVVAAALGRPADYFVASMHAPIEALARDTDLCIAFGEPTSGLIPFLDAASLVMHVSEFDWPADYLVTTPLVGPPGAALVPSWRGASGLRQIDDWLEAPARFVQAQQVQSDAWARGRAGAHAQIFDPAPAPHGPPAQAPAAEEARVLEPAA